MRLEDYPTEPRYSATVLKSEEITEQGSKVEVRELVLEVDKHEFDFDIGLIMDPDGGRSDRDGRFGLPERLD